MKNWAFLAIVACLAYACLDGTSSTDAVAANELLALRPLPEQVDFNLHVKPILSDKCFVCHGPDESKRQAGLGLHDRALALAALGESSDRYAIVPGDAAASELVARTQSKDPSQQMPPPESNLALDAYEIAILEKWIAQGAEYKEHWAFIPPAQPELPAVAGDWPINEIDHFIAARLDAHGFTPSPTASKEKLLRRASFALTGLPPSPKALEAFITSTAPDAYEQAVDDLLISVAYAERMTQIWMDVARYADSHGYQDDPERFMWPWRDWVIYAYRSNLPYNDFVTWQLAGDLMPDANLEQIIATGFNRNHKITYEGGAIDEEFRTEYVADRAQTFGTAFLGLTVECARCHDHKYDPISQRNYFELFAFFNNVDEKGFMDTVGQTPEPFVTLTNTEIESLASFINKPDSIESLELMVMEEMPEPRQAHILNRGQYDQPGEAVQAATPERLLAFGDRMPNRLGLANWLFDAGHPLTARVTVNRLWQQVFGTGIVATSFDFGSQGALPTHPELLDFLAIKFQHEGWDTRAMLKYMVMSATFRQSSKLTPELLEKDPENRLLARASRVRLDAEMIRDHALASAQLLASEIGGPSVKPYQPEGLWAETVGGAGNLRNYVPGKGAQLYRRSLYTFWKRTVPPPSMLTFDAATKDLCTIKRQQTNTPLQALVLMNDPQLLEASRVLAQHALSMENGTSEERLNFLFQRLTSRFPTAAELELLQQQLTQAEADFGADPAAAAAFIGIGAAPNNPAMSAEQLAAYTLVANTIMNLDESINRG